MNKYKIIVFAVSFLGSVFLLILMNTKLPRACYEDSHTFLCSLMSETVFNLSIFFPFILFFSLLTFKMKESVFQAWWQFARFAIPFVFIILYIIGLGLNHHPGGWFNLDNEVDLVEYMLVYTFFVIGSVIQVFRGYHQKETVR